MINRSSFGFWWSFFNSRTGMEVIFNSGELFLCVGQGIDTLAHIIIIFTKALQNRFYQPECADEDT